MLLSAKPAAKSLAILAPYVVGFRVPTIEIELHFGKSPRTTYPIGGDSKSVSAWGHCGSLGVINRPPDSVISFSNS